MKWQRVLWLLLIIGLLVGGVGVYQRLTTSHKQAAYGEFITWGLWVSAYIWFIGLSAGSFLLSSLIYVFRLQRLEQIGKLALFTAVVSLFSALLIIWFDIGRMERFWEIYTRGNPRSMMAWMVWLYTAYFALVTVELWFALRYDLAVWAERKDFAGRLCRLLTLSCRSLATEARVFDRSVVRVLGTIGVPLAIAFHGGVGALFGVVMARPYWNQPIYPVAFLVAALLSGTAFFSTIVAFSWPRSGSAEHREIVTLLGQFTLGLLVLYVLIEWAELSIGMYNALLLNPQMPTEVTSFWLVTGPPYAWVFWLGLVLLGLLVSLGFLLPKARPRSLAWAGAATLVVLALALIIQRNIPVATLANVVLPGLRAPATPLSSPFPGVFWVGNLLLGSLVPLSILVLRSRSPNWVGLAGLLVAFSFLAVRLNIVVPALALPQLPGLERAYVDQRLTLAYFPSLIEWQVLLFVIALAGALFYLGYRNLPVVPYEEAKP